MNGTETIYKEPIARLIGEKVQLFDDLVPISENAFIHSKHEDQAVA
jgi:hypothetical protein